MEESRKDKVKFIVRFVIAAALFITGLNYSNTLFFNENPLFGIPYLAESLISIISGLLGFFLIPTYFFKVRRWVENLVVKTIYDLVNDFWNQYTRKMEINRKARKKERTKEDITKLKEKYKGGVVLDTSILIDGRILNLAKTGFIPQPIIIPKFVINELHLLADNSDEIKRKKGRRGLDLVNHLKKECRVLIFSQSISSEGVDKDLITVAKTYKVNIMTLDFNLNKVAKVSNVKVLNINDLVEAIKPQYIPGDKLNVKVVQNGKEKGQGVGYLPDGTMLVVKDGDKYINSEVDVVVSKLIQSSAGKMLFCELAVT